ncbi:MAG: dTMP kinase [Methanomassiliicoccus sp.]|nr:dTMP kinase [Methanomassiliicoccus sp.]
MDESRGTIAAQGAMTVSGTMTASVPAGGFYVFEGIDGSGKSTIARAFADRLASTGQRVERTAEPTATWLGEQVRRGNREARSDFTETFLYIADRAEHSALIAEWLKDGRSVVCDRYVGSTLAYQSVTLRHHLGYRALEWLKMVNEPVLVRPDVTVLLRIDPEVAIGRLSGRAEREKFEQVEFLRKVAAMYDRLATEDPSYVVVDASAPPEEVLERVWGSMGKR